MKQSLPIYFAAPALAVAFLMFTGCEQAPAPAAAGPAATAAPAPAAAPPQVVVQEHRRDDDKPAVKDDHSRDDRAKDDRSHPNDPPRPDHN
jgi:hypothetical protein